MVKQASRSVTHAGRRGSPAPRRRKAPARSAEVLQDAAISKIEGDDMLITGTEGGKSQTWWCRLVSAAPL